MNNYFIFIYYFLYSAISTGWSKSQVWYLSYMTKSLDHFLLKKAPLQVYGISNCCNIKFCQPFKIVQTSISCISNRMVLSHTFLMLPGISWMKFFHDDGLVAVTQLNGQSDLWILSLVISGFEVM